MSNIQIDANNRITIKGAREHNLKNVNLVLPRNKLIVMTGLSGSGKSSLAFDTIFADGQRRYMESLSSYARMFLGQMEKPDVDEITGLSPAVSIDQKTTSHNPRSTVGTVTEIYDYLRLMYARIGVPHCPVCGRVISQQTVDEMVDEVLKLPERTRFQVLAPVVRGRKGTQAKELDAARRGGYARVRIDGNMYDLDEEIKLEKNIKHTVEIVVDRLSINDTVRGRLADSIETAVALTGGLVIIDVIGGEPMEFSQNYACPEHGVSIDELSPRMFSFNNPFGACETCTGLGTFMKVDPARVIPDPRKSIRESAIKASGWYYAEGSISEMYYKALGKRYGFTLDTPIQEMSKEAVHAILYGTGTEKIEMQRENMFGSGTYMNTFEGIIPNLERRFRETGSEWVKEEIALVMSSEECPACHGRRLKPTSLAVTVGGINIADEYANLLVRFGHWKDTAILLRGEAVQSFTLMFLQMWNLTEKEPRWDEALLPSPPVEAEGYVMPYCDCPLDDYKVGESVYMDILNRAKDYVHIMTPYLILDNEMETALKFAAQRGVDVKLILPGIPDKKLVFRLSRSYYVPLLRAGVRIYEYTPGFLHAKCYVSDDHLAVVGSINMDYRSLFLHFECGALLYSNSQVIALREDVLATLPQCREVRLSDCRTSLPGTLLDSVLRLLSPLL